jgi:SAM-dependent methyltransferase
MTNETFQPISVKAPSASPLAFALRCLIDLQLGTIVKPLRPAMAALPTGTILDVGAGQSPWREWLPGHCRYVGLDIQNANDFGMAPPSGDIHFYDGHVMPFADATFDGAICIEVLEHAADPDELLREAARVLKPGAVLLLTTPWSARRHHIPYDFHRFTRERLAVMLATHGFQDVAVQERGDDIDAIANKLIVLTLGSLKRVTLINALLLLPLSVLFALLSAVMLCVAHLPRGWGLGSNADPLGYFCRAVRASAST